MATIICDKCGGRTDNVYCEDCVRELKEEIKDLEREIQRLEEEYK